MEISVLPPPCRLGGRGGADGLNVSRFSHLTGGSRWGLGAPAGVGMGWTRLDLKDVPWPCAGDICGVALQAAENEVQAEDLPCEPVTLVIWRGMRLCVCVCVEVDLDH